ncbi:hypothetical protein IV79_GL000720 [Pediococcus claussenii]|nr:hypothetical protein IV79_GL000720 [Pediococcus claussenii]
MIVNLEDVFMSRMTSYQKKVTASTLLGFTLENMDAMFISFSLASIISTLHISNTQAGLLPSITSVGSLIGGILFGILADRFGRVRTLSWSIIIYAIGTTATGFTNSFFMLCLFRVVMGIGASGEYGIAITMLSEAFSRKVLGRMTSFASIAGQIGSIVASVLAAVIIPNLGWHALFFFGIIPVILAVLVRLGMKESAVFREQKYRRDKNQVKGNGWKKLFNTPATAFKTIRLIMMGTVQIAGYYGLMNWLPTIMQKRLNVGVASSSLWMISTIVGMSLGMFCFGMIQDRLGSRVAFSVWLLMSAVVVYLILFAQNQFEMIVAGMILGFFSDGMYGGFGVIISQLYDTDVRATANNTIMGISKGIGNFSSVLIGFLMDNFQLSSVMIFLSVIYLISFMTMYSIKQLHHDQKRSEIVDDGQSVPL